MAPVSGNTVSQSTSLQQEALRRAQADRARAAQPKPPPARLQPPRDGFEAAQPGKASQAQSPNRYQPLTPQQELRKEAQSIQITAQANPVYSSRLLEDALKGKSAKDQAALLRDPQVAQALETYGRISIDKDPSDPARNQAVVATLSRISERLSPQDASALTDSFARGLPDDTVGASHNDRLGGALQQAIGSGSGTRFGAELINSLAKAEKGQAADDVAKAVHQSVKALHDDFSSHAKKVEDLEELSGYVQGFGPALTSQERDNAIKAFRDRHQEDYKALEASSAKFATTLNGLSSIKNNPTPTEQYHPVYVVVGGVPTPQTTRPIPSFPEFAALQGEVDSSLRELPRLGQTDAGIKAIGQAVEDKSHGKSTFLDVVPSVASTANDATAFTNNVATLAVRATGLRALKLAREGRPADVQNLLRGLESNSALFGGRTAELHELSGTLNRFLQPGQTPAQLAALGRTLDRNVANLTGGLGPQNSGLGQGLRSLGVVFSALSVTDGWTKFDDASLKDKIQTVSDSVQLGSDGGTLVLDIFARSSNALKFAGPAAGAVGSILEATDAVNSFREGKVPEGIASSAIAVGGLVTAAAALNVVPGVGSLAGAGLVVVGTAAEFTIGLIRNAQEEGEHEANLRAFLEGGGLSKQAARDFANIDHGRNVGAFIVQLAQAQHVDPAKYLDFLASPQNDGDTKRPWLVNVAYSVQDDQSHIRAEDPKDPTSYLAVNPSTGSTYFDNSKPLPHGLAGAVEYLRALGLGATTITNAPQVPGA